MNRVEEGCQLRTHPRPFFPRQVPEFGSTVPCRTENGVCAGVLRGPPRRRVRDTGKEETVLTGIAGGRTPTLAR